MNNFKRIDQNSNAFTFQFKENSLNEIRESYRKYLKPFLSKIDNGYLLEGGRSFSQAIENEYFLTSFGTYPLLWCSNNTDQTYQIYKRFFKQVSLDEKVKSLVDYDKKIVMYCGFLVIGNHAPGYAWHVDYFPNANGYTLITPLFEPDPVHGNLLYKDTDNQVKTYHYKLNEAIIFGDGFFHTTKPYSHTKNLRILLSLTFGTDKLSHWNVLKRTIGSQSNYMILPCGHRFGTCYCLSDFSYPGHSKVQQRSNSIERS